MLEGIYRISGYDFRNYVLSSIRRRIWHRVQAERLTTITGLQEKIFHDTSCMERLIKDFSIQVTEMFRDPGFFISFRKNVIPLIKKSPLIKIWHAGCSTGEEVYSMAILLSEEGLYDKTRLYATDINENAIEMAKRGVYSLGKMKTYTSNYLNAGGRQSFSNYYTLRGENAVFDNVLRKNIVFAKHNLVSDSSFNEFNVIICRNVLIYFNKELENKVHGLFYNSLGPRGILALGKKETIKFTTYNDNYSKIDNEENIYQKMQKGANDEG
ncbi:CheR family methyltransferase [Desulfosporosinus youngiae]|uniref:Methylase of chemotaxis methyl-accepting protein n=1 Tax=Desulfosporosinus youngiae DSM 17734 TaxID=768710 RepID=H5XV35_9FIRM|nr:protein-glutamate O-methyltransferase CheR [Desulfosporosinus youngiae]EHQ89633.1 methylase of chemotaxis methyl-accepting protein [Desulfosporosinus youngiae DSM 17734]